MRVILAPRRAAAIALRNPEALVVDYQGQCIRRGADRIVLGKGRKPTQLFRICVAMCCAVGRSIGREDLLDAMFGDDPYGGPLHAESVLAKNLTHTRPFRAWAGLTITRSIRGRIEVSETAPRRHAHGSSFRISLHGVWPVGVAA